MARKWLVSRLGGEGGCVLAYQSRIFWYHFLWGIILFSFSWAGNIFCTADPKKNL